MSSTGGFNIGLTALIAHRQTLDVIGQNLANVNTEGYSRQRVNLKPDAGPISPAVFSIYDGTGSGVRINGIARLRDQFLEARAHQEFAYDAQLNRTKELIDGVETTFSEPSDNGLGALLGDFIASWSSLANAPGELASRSQVVERGETLAAAIRNQDSNLQGQRRAAADQLANQVSQINLKTRQFSALNDRIRSAQADGDPANELRDQRDQLAIELSKAIGARFVTGTEGAVDVFLGAQVLVRSESSEELRVATAPGTGNVSVNFVANGSPASVGGDALASIQGVNEVIPRYRTELAAIATKLADEVNAVHTASYDRSGNPGQAFFTFGSNGIVMNPVVRADPNKVAASAIPGGNLDGSAAREISRKTGAQKLYGDTVVRVAVEAQAASRRVDVQANVVKQIENARDATSGVNVDEEMANLLATQRAYEAAARFISVLDEVLDTLVNRLVR
jgi:flagellar hook-associated protein 1 FlgK